MRVWDEGQDFKELVAKDRDVRAHLDPQGIDRIFSLQHYLRNVEKVYKRVFRSDVE
jgi:adenylosuccinate lyase